MHSVILRLGPVAIRGYGLMLAISFLVGIYLAVWRAKKAGISPERIMSLALYVLISSVVGARLLYVLFHWDEYASDPWSVVSPFQGGQLVGIGGLVFYGGAILAILVGIWYLERHKMPTWKVADVVAPSIALGVFFTRIGCFLNGCCFGIPSRLPWAMLFPPDSDAGSVFPGIAIHPTQLYSSLYGLAIFGILLWAERFKTFDGYTFWLFIVLYAVARFLVDFVRYYEPSMTLLGRFSVNQLISVALFVLGAAAFTSLWQIQLRREKQGAARTSAQPEGGP